MRCKQCDYRLWNLRGRDCPECGAPFKPSDYEFNINSVRFCCPHCNQAYYGTGESGHLVPIEFDCVSCHRHIHMDQTVVLPTENVREEQTQVDQNPWLDRQKRGRMRGWFATIGQGMVLPHRIIEATPPNSSAGQALWFAAVTWFVYLLIGMLPLALYFLAMTAVAAMAGGLLPMIAKVVWPVGIVLVFLLLMFLWIGVTHVLLRVTGPLSTDVNRTIHAICYSSGTNVFSAVPCLSVYVAWIGWIWWSVCATIMIQRGHRVSGRRAAFATLTLPGILLLALMGLVGWGMHEMSVTMQNANLRVLQANQTSMQTIGSELIQYAADHDDRLPAHAGALLITRPVTINELTVTPSMTNINTIRFAGITGAQFGAMTRQEKQAAVQQAADMLPADTVAYRLGDVVFTYPGIDLGGADPGLWLAVNSLDPQANQMLLQSGAMGQSRQFVAATPDGTTIMFDSNQLTAQLQTQNQLRASFNMPPLPDPSTVLHDQPHTAGDVDAEP